MKKTCYEQFTQASDLDGFFGLGWILERWDGVMWTGLVWLRIGTGEELL
jgi:hypothetical protein